MSPCLCDGFPEREPTKKQLERELCQARCLLQKYVNGDELTTADREECQRHLKLHRNHRLDDIKYNLKESQRLFKTLTSQIGAVLSWIEEGNFTEDQVKESGKMLNAAQNISKEFSPFFRIR